MNLDNPSLSIGELSRRTGVPVATLRAWERRHGFPEPVRLTGGHRRYTGRDVESVAEVVEERQGGTGLAAALTRAMERRTVPRSSIMGTVRFALADVAPVVLSKRTLMAMSRAVEDEAASRAERPLLVGAFQEERYLRQAEERWTALARTASATITFAHPGGGRATTATWAVPLERSDPLTREWAVICDSPTFAACLVATERLVGGAPGDSGPHRSFEALWTVEPAVVREAARTAVGLAAHLRPELAAVVGDRLRGQPSAGRDDVRAATSLMNRLAATLDRR